MINKNGLHKSFNIPLAPINNEMQPLRDGTLKLFFVSGTMLVILCVVGSFALTALAVNSIVEKVWFRFFYLLVAGVSAIALYYLLIAFFGWLLLKRARKKAAAKKPA